MASTASQIDPAAKTEDAKEHRRRQVRESKARLDERLKGMTKLEQAAWREREALGEKSPYTPQELEEAEAIRALQDELERRARQLNAQVIHRLEREASRDEAKAALLARFRSCQGVRLELSAF